MMALVSTITLYQTIHISTVILLCKGWKFVRSSLSKEDLSSVTLLMTIVYLSHSAYFVTASITRMQSFMDSWMNMLSCLIFIYILRECSFTQRALRYHCRTYQTEFNVQNSSIF